MPRFQVQVTRCKVCEKCVYPMEELIADNIHYHKGCFRCHECNRTLSTGSYASLDGAIFCKPHFLQLFKAKGNYEEGFGKERYKNKWNGPNTTVQVNANGQTTIVQADVSEERENVAPLASSQPTSTSNSTSHSTVGTKGTAIGTNGVHDTHFMKQVTTAPSKTEIVKPKVTHPKPAVVGAKPDVIGPKPAVIGAKPSYGAKPPLTDKTHLGGPRSVVNKAKVPQRLEQAGSAKIQKKCIDSTDGGVVEESLPISLELKRSRLLQSNSVKQEVDKPAPGKLAKWQPTSTRHEAPSTILKPTPKKLNVDWTAKTQHQKVETKTDVPMKFSELGSVKTRFEKGEVGKKDFKSEAMKEEVDLVVKTKPGVAKSTKSQFEKPKEKQYDSTKRKELDELQMARALATQKKPEEEEESVPASAVIAENERYKELEVFRESAATRETLQRFRSGPFSNREETEQEARKEVETILGSGAASSTKEKYEKGEYEKVEYVSPVKQEIETIKADTTGKKNLYESGGMQREYESDVRKELQTLKTEAVDTKQKFESGELLNSRIDNSDRQTELETIKSVSGAGDKKSKFESGELIRKTFDSDVRKELETMETKAADTKNKYESGELIRQEFDSETKKELATLETGAMEKKNKYETGDVEHVQYESEVKKDLETVRTVVPGSSSVRNMYQEAVTEGNKIQTSKPVTIEKAKPEEMEPPEDYYEPRQDSEDENEANGAEHDSSDGEPINEDTEYVAPVLPGKLTNVEEKFKKPEVQKMAPVVNKIQIPTFEKQPDSDEELNGEIPDENETEAMKAALWTTKTSDIKSKFESINQDEGPKEAAKPIDLQAEISAYKEHIKKNKPRRPKSKRPKSNESSENGDETNGHIHEETPIES